MSLTTRERFQAMAVRLWQGKELTDSGYTKLQKFIEEVWPIRALQSSFLAEPPRRPAERPTKKQAEQHKRVLRQFDGATYDHDKDGQRLNNQFDRVFAVMCDQGWYRLDDIAVTLGCTPQSVSARVRDFRKKKFGGHTVNRRRVAGSNGLHEYQLIPQGVDHGEQKRA